MKLPREELDSTCLELVWIVQYGENRASQLINTRDQLVIVRDEK
jgi:hypothetical protein